uniref:Predicted protein n=1 Tax=Physcomitrium patens TaxID=3218 RepID=A9TMG1_PHYPA
MSGIWRQLKPANAVQTQKQNQTTEKNHLKRHWGDCVERSGHVGVAVCGATVALWRAFPIYGFRCWKYNAVGGSGLWIHYRDGQINSFRRIVDQLSKQHMNPASVVAAHGFQALDCDVNGG